jgi:PhnB protein
MSKNRGVSMSDIRLEAYLFFTGNCREAMEFYKEVFGGELTMQTYGEVPGDKPEEMQGMDDKIMHATLRTDAIHFMATDSTRKEKFGESFISLSLGGSDEETLRGYFEKLSEGGKVTAELKKEFWGDLFGTVTDKFGVDWMVNVTTKSE